MIQRDSSNPSLWQKTSAKFTPTNKAERKIYDVIIIGGGITGLSTALSLQESGFKCLVLEAKNLCFGTTGGTTAHLNTLLDTPYGVIEKKFSEEDAKIVADATRDALRLIQSNIRKYAIDCEYESCHAYLFSQEEKQSKELKEIIESSSKVGIDIKRSDTIPAPLPFLEAAEISGQGKFNPIKYVYGLATAFEKSGGVIVQGCRALDLKESDPSVVRTTKGLFKGRFVIYATHTPPGVNLIHLRCQPFRSYAMAVTLKNKKYPAGLTYDMYDPYHYYRSQVIDGKSYLIVGGYDHKTGKEENTQGCFQQLERHVRSYFKIGRKVSQWSSQYFEPADGLPYIGRLPGHSENIFTAAAFGGNGMTYSHVSAILFKSILLNEESPYIKLFDPNRIKPVAGFTNFITQNVEVVKNFVGKIMSGPSVENFNEMGNGEGKIITYEHEKIAAFKDETGNIHAVKPTCNHMGCEVAWNNAERSWDCSCHGARYSYDGEVLTVPAVKNLEKIVINESVKQS